MPPRPSPKAKPPGRRPTADFPPRLSSGYLVRDAHRAFQRLLERRIAPYGVTRGQWYFLRVLWNADGLSQRELSARVGMMEPTTVIALRSMERSGLIRRVRSNDDRRKVRVTLTAKAKRLRHELLGRGADHHRGGGSGYRRARPRRVPRHHRADDRQPRSCGALTLYCPARFHSAAAEKMRKPLAIAPRSGAGIKPKRGASPASRVARSGTDASYSTRRSVTVRRARSRIM